MEEGLKQMSLYLVSDFAYEMRDVSGTPADILYTFLGAPQLMTEAEVTTIVSNRALAISTGEAIDLLLWYGFLGFYGEASRPLFIYDVEYDFRRLEAERNRLSENLFYVVNVAFTKGLDRVA